MFFHLEFFLFLRNIQAVTGRKIRIQGLLSDKKKDKYIKSYYLIIKEKFVVYNKEKMSYSNFKYFGRKDGFPNGEDVI